MEDGQADGSAEANDANAGGDEAMILELVATCLLAAGTTYTPPDGWRVEQVGIAGVRNVCSQSGFLMNCLAVVVVPIDQSYVVVRRVAKVGETIEAPPGCTLRAETKP